VAIGRNMPVAIEIIQQDEIIDQFVMIRSDFFTKKNQRRVAIAARNITENLVVSPVLLNDIKHMLNG